MLIILPTGDCPSVPQPPRCPLRDQVEETITPSPRFHLRRTILDGGFFLEQNAGVDGGFAASCFKEQAKGPA